MATNNIAQARQQIGQAEQLLSQKREEATQARQSIERYRQSLPKAYSQKLLRTKTGQNPLMQRLTRHKISKAELKSSEALQQVKSYEDQLSKYQKEQIDPVKAQIQEYDARTASVKEAQGAFNRGLSIKSDFKNPYTSNYLKEMYQKQELLQQGATDYYNKLNADLESYNAGNIQALDKYGGIENLQRKGRITLSEVPTFTQDKDQGMQSQLDFNKNLEPVEIEKKSVISKLSSLFGKEMIPTVSAQEVDISGKSSEELKSIPISQGGYAWEVGPAPERGIFAKAENIFQKGFQKVFGGQTLKEVEAKIFPNPNRDDSSVGIGFYPSSVGQVVKDVASLPRNTLVEFASPSVGYLSSYAAEKAIPEYRGGLIQIEQKIIPGGWRETENFGSISTQPTTQYFEERIIPSRQLFERERVIEGIRMGGELGTTIAGYTFGGSLLLGSSVSAGTQTVFNPRLSTPERIFGGAEAVLSGTGLGYSGYKFLKQPIIKRVPIPEDMLKLPSFARDKGSMAQVSSTWDNIFQSKIRLGKTDTSKYGFEFIKNEPYKVNPYTDKTGYQNTLKNLIKQGYTEKEARQLIRFNKPKPIIDFSSSVENVIKLKDIKDMSKFAAYGKIDIARISPYSGKTLKVRTQKFVSEYNLFSDPSKISDKISRIKFTGRTIVSDTDKSLGIYSSRGIGVTGETTKTAELTKNIGIVKSDISKIGKVKETDDFIKLIKTRNPKTDDALSIIYSEELPVVNVKGGSIQPVKSEMLDIRPNADTIFRVGESKTNVIIPEKLSKGSGDISFIRGGERKTITNIVKSDIKNIVSESSISKTKIKEPSINIPKVKTYGKSTTPISTSDLTITTTEAKPEIISFKDMSISTRITESNNINKQNQKLDSKNLYNIKSKTLSVSLPKQKEKTLSISNLSQDNILIPKQTQKTYQKQTQNNVLVSTATSKQIDDKLTIRPQQPKPQTPKPQQPKPQTPKPIIKTPKLSLNRLRKTTTKKKEFSREEKFLAITRRRGKEVILGVAETAQKAEQIAKRNVLGTLGATVKVKTTSGKQVQLRPDKLFTQSKTDPLAIVQRKSTSTGGRLGSLGERREIKQSRRNVFLK